ncbi:hypothetical protein [Bradyrhizobium canariense]|uniref:Uncharacterized protein n=1 Tax=Bradyrhizobium canariense TaxID=255045 RepID=A0A1H1NAJ0_9BRAD|nr:hypothetical protein [Bradyrhizobium canariense]SDR95765.1 hypothetical protein SAMN05444158_0540 [Bradyrhizobium canariense]
MNNNRNDLVPMAIAALIAAAGVVAIFLMDFRTDGNSQGADGMITASVVSRAGAVATPSEPAPHVAAPQTMSARTP